MHFSAIKPRRGGCPPLKEKFGLFVDFEFLTEMGAWGTESIPVGLRKILQRKVVENGVRKNAHVPVFRAEMIVTQYVL